MLREIKKNGGHIFNHSHKHKSFVKYSSEEIIEDVILAEKIINENLGEIEKIISYPYGESNKSVEDLIQKLGYKIAFSQHSSPIHFRENKYNLPRFSINDEYGQIKRFKQIVNLEPLILNFFEILTNKKDKSSLEINFIPNLNSQNVNCFISDGVLTKVVVENFVKLKLTELNKDKRYRINCTAFEKNKIYWFGKMMIKENGAFKF